MRDELERLAEHLEEVLELTDRPWPSWDEGKLRAVLLEVRQVAAGALCEVADLQLLAEMNERPE